MGMRGGPRVAFVPAVSMLHRSFNGGPRGASRLMLPVASASAQFAPGPKTHVPLQLERVARSTSDLHRSMRTLRAHVAIQSARSCEDARSVQRYMRDSAQWPRAAEFKRYLLLDPLYNKVTYCSIRS